MRRLLLAAALLALAAPGAASAATRTLSFDTRTIEVDGYGVRQAVLLVPSPKVDGYVVGLSGDVVDLRGRHEPIDRIMLHHVVLSKLTARDNTCSSYVGFDGRRSPVAPQRFFGEGEERTELHLPAGYGYPNRAKDRWLAVVMLMNHRAQAETVRVRYRVRYVTGEPRIAVEPYWVDVRNCESDPIFNVPGTGGPGSRFACRTRARWG